MSRFAITSHASTDRTTAAMPIQTAAIDLPRAQALLREGLAPHDVVTQLDTTLRTLQRAFSAAGLPSPRKWQFDQIGSRAEGSSPIVSFRLPEYEALEEAAAKAEKKPSDYAREVVQKHLRRKK